MATELRAIPAPRSGSVPPKAVPAVPAVPASGLGRRSTVAKRAVLAAVRLIGVALAYWWSRRSTPPVGIDSIAVLPFAASGAPAESEYLTDGITETLINGLSQLPSVPAR